MLNLTTPRLEQRAEQPCMFIRAHVRMAEIGTQLPALVPQLFAWIGSHGVQPGGPVFFRYNVVDMEGLMEIDVGVVVQRAVAGDAQVKAGVIPGGTYLTMRHVGHPDELMEATRSFLDWGNTHHVAWCKKPRGSAEVWDARFEFYLDGPDTQPDMTKWRTDLAFQVEAR